MRDYNTISMNIHVHNTDFFNVVANNYKTFSELTIDFKGATISYMFKSIKDRDECREAINKAIKNQRDM